jgi:hypothetical protein
MNTFKEYINNYLAEDSIDNPWSKIRNLGISSENRQISPSQFEEWIRAWKKLASEGKYSDMQWKKGNRVGAVVVRRGNKSYFTLKKFPASSIGNAFYRLELSYGLKVSASFKRPHWDFKTLEDALMVAQRCKEQDRSADGLAFPASMPGTIKDWLEKDITGEK